MKTLVVFIITLLTIKVTRTESLTDAVKNLVSGEKVAVQECKKQLKFMVASGKISLANEMTSSWSTFRPEMKYGNSYDFGDYDRCMRIRDESEDYGSVGGQYCMIQFYSLSMDTIPQKPTRSYFNVGWENISTRFGGAVCVPSSCPPETVRDLMTEFFNGSDYTISTDYNQSEYCKKSEPNRKTPTVYFVFGFTTAMLVLLVALSTFYDVRTHNREMKNRNQLFLSFSCYTNATNLFNIEQHQSSDEIKCLHGVRGVSIISIIFLHSYYFRAMFPIHHPNQLNDFIESAYGRFISGITVSVDSFFVMSGMLVTRTILRDLESGRFNIFKLYFLRYMRLTPALAYALLVNLALGHYFVQHSPFAFEKDLIESCEKWWWTTLLHIQVITNRTEICMLTTWFLSVEWQMFLVAPFIIYPAWRFGKKILPVLLPALLLASFIYAYVISYSNHIFIEDLYLNSHQNSRYYQTMYLPTEIRGSTFLIGMFLGYVFKAPKSKFNVKRKIFKVIMWTLALIAVTTISFPYISKYLTNETSFAFNTFIIVSSRDLWAFAVAWLIFSLDNGAWQCVRDFFAHKFWVPIGKCGLSIYLVHPVLLCAVLSSQRQPVSYDIFQMLNDFFGNMSMTFLLSVLLHLLVEEPFTRIGKIIARNWSGKLKNNKIESVLG